MYYMDTLVVCSSMHISTCKVRKSVEKKNQERNSSGNLLELLDAKDQLEFDYEQPVLAAHIFFEMCFQGFD